jgi:hypothetical protein
MSVPATRQALFQAIADEIGWGMNAAGVEDYIKRFEARGVRFTLAIPTPEMVEAAIKAPQLEPDDLKGAIGAAIAASPYAPGRP